MEHLGARFGLLVFDECHHLPGASYAMSARQSLAPFRLGLSATPERAGGRHADLAELIGPIGLGRHRTNRAILFRLEAQAPSLVAAEEPPRLSDEVALLLSSLQALKTEWRVCPSTAILGLPGIELCVPDLAFFYAATGARVYLEVLGFWSREAVWRRVELIEAGLPERILFAMSKHLRVSEEVLGSRCHCRYETSEGRISGENSCLTRLVRKRRK